jgi:hypothetical protein
MLKLRRGGGVLLRSISHPFVMRPGKVFSGGVPLRISTLIEFSPLRS